MYHHCLRLAYDLAFENKLLLNGEPVKKKSTQVYTVSKLSMLCKSFKIHNVMVLFCPRLRREISLK